MAPRSSPRHLICRRELPETGAVSLSGQDHRRLADILRAQPGERFILRAPGGALVSAELLTITSRDATVKIIGRADTPPSPPRRITLVQALGKGDRFEQVLKHGTELGAAAFIPLMTARTVRRFESRALAAKMTRWRAILEAAAEQSQRERTPDLADPLTLPEAAKRMAEHTTTYIMHPEATEDLYARDALDRAADAALYIGPEGGFTDDETSLLSSHGAVAVRLSPFVLRTETAALAALSVLLWSRPPR